MMSVKASMNRSTSRSVMISGGISLITSRWSPDTWVRIRCRCSSGTTTICANSPLRAACRAVHPVRSLSDLGRPNSMPIISPRPRTSASSSYLSTSAVSRSRNWSPILRAFSTTFSSRITSRVASPAAMAWAFDPKLAECTSTRSIEEYTFSKIQPLPSVAPTGTYPPESALAAQTRSGSTPSSCW